MTPPTPVDTTTTIGTTELVPTTTTVTTPGTTTVTVTPACPPAPAPKTIAVPKGNPFSGRGMWIWEMPYTEGGNLKGGCDNAGAFRSAPYAADYVFLRKG